MNTLRLRLRKMDMEKMALTISMAIVEGFGMIALVCGILNIKIF